MIFRYADATLVVNLQGAAPQHSFAVREDHAPHGSNTRHMARTLNANTLCQMIPRLCRCTHRHRRWPKSAGAQGHSVHDASLGSPTQNR